MSAEERHETFEATSRVLDEHPELVDELYATARQHRPLLDRFLMNAAKDLKERPMAELTAKHLVEDPGSLEEVLVTTIDFIVRRPEARAAMNRAMVCRAESAVDILTDSPQAMTRILQTAIVAIESKPQARRTTLTAVRKNRARLLAMVKQDPELMKEISEEVVREAVKDSLVAEKALRAAKIIDDERAEPKDGSAEKKKGLEKPR
jgi:hypothetical protein